MTPGFARLLTDLDEARRAVSALRRDVEGLAADLLTLSRDVEDLRRDLLAESRMNDELDEITEQRVAELELLIAARWPRSALLRRRLAKDLRKSVKEYGGAGDFVASRFEAVGDGWLGEPPSTAGRHVQRRGER